jgi:proline racemase
VEITATDYHTAGEPFRIVTAGVPEIAGSTVRDRREHAAASEAVDEVRRLLCHEPRGHADMYGCFLDVTIDVPSGRVVARVLGEAPGGVLIEIEGMAFRTGEHRFVLDPRDPLDTGFVLR